MYEVCLTDDNGSSPARLRGLDVQLGAPYPVMVTQTQRPKMTDNPDPPPQPQPAELSANLQALSAAIRAHGAPPQVALCGFDMWLEIMTSGHIGMRDFLAGGTPAKGDEEETVLKVPIAVLGGRIVISFDPTLPPDKFVLKP